jgi:hypothetical protein
VVQIVGKLQSSPCAASCFVVFASLQDTVPRGGKFISAYKRNGQRVIVNKAGDMVVSKHRRQMSDMYSNM